MLRLKKMSQANSSNIANLSHICLRVHRKFKGKLKIIVSFLVLKEREYEPDDPEALLAAFKVNIKRILKLKNVFL